MRDAKAVRHWSLTGLAFTVEHEQPRTDGAGGENAQADPEVARRILHPAHQVRADEPAEVADRVDQADAGGRAVAAQERRRQRPERRRAPYKPIAPIAAPAQRQRRDRRVRECGDREPRWPRRRSRRNVPVAAPPSGPSASRQNQPIPATRNGIAVHSPTTDRTAGQPLHNLRQEETESVAARDDQEQDEREPPAPPGSSRPARTVAEMRLRCSSRSRRSASTSHAFSSSGSHARPSGPSSR